MNNGRLQFFNLVKAMREAKREYFSTRSHEALHIHDIKWAKELLSNRIK